ncbi:MAG: outer membrane beta-barrel protein, partial [Pseudomonadota bacterium]
MSGRIAFTGSVVFGLLLATVTPAIAQQRPDNKVATATWSSDYDAIETWTGFYAGAHAGAGAFSGRALDWGVDIFDTLDGDINLEAAAALGGAQVGYNWQSGALVTGIEADFTATGFAENRSFDGSDFYAEANMPWMATLRARLGLASGNTMAYVTAGLAVAQLEHCGNDNDPCSTDNDDDIEWNEVRPGIVAGAGVETRIDRNWSLKGEYLYVNILDTDVVYDDDSDPADGGEQVRFGNQSHQVRIGINYHVDGLPYEPGETDDDNLWTGLYLGAHAGAGAFSGRAFDWGRDIFDQPSGDLNQGAAAALGGVQAGYNWQSGALVTGIEADFTATGFSENRSFFSNDTNKFVQAEMPWMATVRARMGLASGNTMAYVTAGLAIARLEHCANRNEPCSTAAINGNDDIAWNEVRPGIVAGAGVETRLSHDWSLKGEYLYVNIIDTDVVYDDNEDPGDGGQQAS